MIVVLNAPNNCKTKNYLLAQQYKSQNTLIILLSQKYWAISQSEKNGRYSVSRRKAKKMRGVVESIFHTNGFARGINKRRLSPAEPWFWWILRWWHFRVFCSSDSPFGRRVMNLLQRGQFYSSHCQLHNRVWIFQQHPADFSARRLPAQAFSKFVFALARGRREF